MKVKIKTHKTEVSADYKAPKDFKKAVIIANGAGAPMDSDFITYFHKRAAEKYFAVRFNFIYQEIGRRSPDRGPIAEETYKDVFAWVKNKTGLTAANIVIGGKSMGGRIASQIAAELKVKKLVFLGYPLHPPGKPDNLRDAHLYDLKAKMLFIGGDRDSLCKSDKLEQVLTKLPGAEFFKIDGGDHSFKVPKKSGRTYEEVLEEAADKMLKFIR